MTQFFTSGGQSVRVSASASVLPMNIQDWFPLGRTGLISLQSQGWSRVSIGRWMDNVLIVNIKINLNESPLDCKEIKPVNPEGNQSWIFTGRTNDETPILWPPDVKNWLIGKDPDAGKDWRQGEKGMTEDEMVGWHHRFDGHEFEQAPGVGNGQGSLMCCSPWGQKVRHDWVTELNLKWRPTYLNNC